MKTLLIIAGIALMPIVEYITEPRMPAPGFSIWCDGQGHFAPHRNKGGKTGSFEYTCDTLVCGSRWRAVENSWRIYGWDAQDVEPAKTKYDFKECGK